MKKIFLALAIAAASLGTQTYAFDLKDVLGKVGDLGSAGDAITGLVDGIFTQSDITVEQMAGTWTATGSAVCFQSENFLKKAGGSAAASTIEGKLNPYYKQYGLTGSVLTIDSSGKFTLKVKGITLSGTVKKRSDGNFDFTFSALGTVKLGTIKAYVEKPVSGLNVMFDASKLKSLITTITNLTGNSLAKTAGSLLDGYDGLCVGFAFSGTGSSNSNSSNGSNGTTNKNDVINNVTNSLKNLLKK